jgi:hypothetical protein
MAGYSKEGLNPSLITQSLTYEVKKIINSTTVENSPEQTLLTAAVAIDTALLQVGYRENSVFQLVLAGGVRLSHSLPKTVFDRGTFQLGRGNGPVTEDDTHQNLEKASDLAYLAAQELIDNRETFLRFEIITKK